MPELQIARIETFLFDPGLAKNLLFCRVETEEGVHGWGEAGGYDPFMARLYSGSPACFATMSHSAISIALHADNRSSDARRIA